MYPIDQRIQPTTVQFVRPDGRVSMPETLGYVAATVEVGGHAVFIAECTKKLVTWPDGATNWTVHNETRPEPAWWRPA